ncbi:MAG: ATP-binding cassette domain-containing protein [Erysipelotrichaceae bacterium]|nr:ATP-binding cassette domain-containing protein [Erysipelotrichaceae bacterium]
MTILEVNQINKAYGQHHVLKDVSFKVEESDFFIITGVSGCGKSTLLNIIGMLDQYDSGSIKLYGEDLPKPFSRKAEKLLKDKIGYLFQNFALIENETVRYNLEIIMDGKSKDKTEKIAHALKLVNLEGYEDKKIYECSGGQQQRIALSRLLLKPCDLILADEPTGSLDTKTKDEIINILLEFKKQGKTIIMVTHDESLLKYSTQRLELKVH